MKNFIFFTGIFCIVFCMGLKNYSALFFIPEKYSLKTSSFLSNQYKNSILALLNDTKLFGHECIALLHKEFPLVQGISLAYYPHQAKVEISIDTTLCCINNQFILTSNNIICPKDNFIPELLEDIIHVSMHESLLNNRSNLIQLLQSLPAEFHKTYIIQYNNDYDISFIHKQDHQFRILTSYEKYNQLFFSYCDQIKKGIQEQKSKDNWILDTRFENYIVAYKIEGESWHDLTKKIV